MTPKLRSMVVCIVISLLSAIAAVVSGVGSAVLCHTHRDLIPLGFVVRLALPSCLLGGSVGALQGKFWWGAATGVLAAGATLVALVCCGIQNLGDWGPSVVAGTGSLVGGAIGGLHRSVWWGAAAGLLGACSAAVALFVIALAG